MPLGITARAARIIIDFTRKEIAKLGGDHVPGIAWIVGDSDSRRSVPRLAVGIGEREQLKGRLLPCEAANFEIFQALPDEILQEYQSHLVDVKDDQLVFVRNPT